MEAITGLTFTMDGETYVLHNGAAEGWFYQGTEIDVTDLETALGALSADSFTEETPTGKEELHLTLTLNREDVQTVDMIFYRQDGTNCLAVVDGKPVSYVSRASVMKLVEAVQAFVL